MGQCAELYLGRVERRNVDEESVAFAQAGYVRSILTRSLPFKMRPSATRSVLCDANL
jgi:hypothetical protein